MSESNEGNRVSGSFHRPRGLHQKNSKIRTAGNHHSWMAPATPRSPWTKPKTAAKESSILARPAQQRRPGPARPPRQPRREAVSGRGLCEGVAAGLKFTNRCYRTEASTRCIEILSPRRAAADESYKSDTAQAPRPSSSIHGCLETSSPLLRTPRGQPRGAAPLVNSAWLVQPLWC